MRQNRNLERLSLDTRNIQNRRGSCKRSVHRVPSVPVPQGQQLAGCLGLQLLEQHTSGEKQRMNERKKGRSGCCSD